MFYYVARPVKTEGKEVLAVAYVVRHTGPIIRALKQMIANQRAATQMALLLAALGSALLAWTLTRRLRSLTRAARAFADGREDFTVQMRGGDEIAELSGAVTKMANEIAARNRYNRDFISMTIHALKTPLTAIKGAAELLQRGAADKPDARRKFLSNIRYQTERMIRLTGELRELTKLDVETLRGQKEQVEYVSFVREVMTRLETTFEDVHATTRCVLPDEAIPVMLVPGRMEQVLSNLLENAFRYTPPEGEVELRVERQGPHMVITHVRDRGAGIDPDHIDKVFDPFFTTEPKDRPREHGSGLGLSIARRIVENHGGTIGVESSPGAGACFSFTLPC
jgi:two-component system sensor histidine kinase ChvG